MKELKKLGNKGMTTVEILVCFILLILVVVSLYGTVSSFRNKQIIEGYKEQIFTYKNLLTKEIQDDLIKDGLVNAMSSFDPSTNTYTVDMEFRSGSKKRLTILRRLASSTVSGEYESTTVLYTKGDMNMDGAVNEADFEILQNCITGSSTCSDNQMLICDINSVDGCDDTDLGLLESYLSDESSVSLGSVPIQIKSEDKAPDDNDVDDKFEISYGKLNGEGQYDVDMTTYPLPNLGYGENDNGNTIYDLRINNVNIDTSDNVLSIDIGFYHPDFGTRYGINIVCPMNYLS